MKPWDIIGWAIIGTALAIVAVHFIALIVGGALSIVAHFRTRNHPFRVGQEWWGFKRAPIYIKQAYRASQRKAVYAVSTDDPLVRMPKVVSVTHKFDEDELREKIRRERRFLSRDVTVTGGQGGHEQE